MKVDIKNNLFMGLVATATIVDAVENYITHKPINGIGILMLCVVGVYFTSYWTDNESEN